MPVELLEPPPTSDRPYPPRGAARELFACEAGEVLLEGPAGTGKSRAALEKVFMVCDNYPGVRCLLMRQTRESMSESVLVTFETKVVPENHPILSGASRRFRQVYEFSNGSTIVVGGLDKPDKIMSTDYDYIVVFEATEIFEDALEKLTTRLRNGVLPYQQIVCDCNPGASTHWLNQRANAGQMERLLSRHEDNPELHDGNDWTKKGVDYISKLDRLGGHRRERLRFGRWATAEGLVYADWDPAIHVVDREEISTNARDFRRIRVVDFGFVNPFVCQWWCIDGDGRMYLYRELYWTKRLVRDHAARINRYTGSEYIEATVADHDAEDRATLAAEGIETIPAYKAVSPGIEAVAARLRPAEDGRPRLFIVRDCLIERDRVLEDAKKPCCTVEEIDGYIWPKAGDGRMAKDHPLKLDDHGMDSTRYAVAYVDNVGTVPLDARVFGGNDADVDEEEVWEESRWS